MSSRSLTIFTPAYNRASLLPRLYDSLLSQTSHDFEWLVVDDGSSDGTRELVEAWASDDGNPFEIRYFYQENSGKHVAQNRAVREARGELFICVDSDDWLTSDAVSTMLGTKLREFEAGVIFPKLLFEKGKLRETPWFPNGADLIELADMRFEFGLGIETALLFRTNLLAAHPSPVEEGEHFMSEDLVYLSFPRGTRFRISSAGFYECEYLDDGLTHNLFSHWISCPLGAAALFVMRYEVAGRYRLSRRLPAQVKALMNLSALRIALGEGALLGSPNRFMSALLIPASAVFSKVRYREALSA